MNSQWKTTTEVSDFLDLVWICKLRKKKKTNWLYIKRNNRKYTSTIYDVNFTSHRPVYPPPPRAHLRTAPSPQSSTFDTRFTSAILKAGIALHHAYLWLVELITLFYFCMTYIGSNEKRRFFIEPYILSN